MFTIIFPMTKEIILTENLKFENVALNSASLQKEDVVAVDL